MITIGESQPRTSRGNWLAVGRLANGALRVLLFLPPAATAKQTPGAPCS